MEKEKRIRMFELMNYDEFWNPSKALDWLNKVACDYLAVVHDKDVHNDGSKKNKHYHVVIRLKDAMKIRDESLAKAIAAAYQCAEVIKFKGV